MGVEGWGGVTGEGEKGERWGGGGSSKSFAQTGTPVARWTYATARWRFSTGAYSLSLAAASETPVSALRFCRFHDS